MNTALVTTKTSAVMLSEDLRAGFTINEFCAAHRMSRASLYALWNRGQGPRFYLVGSKRVISVESAAAWRAEGEARVVKLMRAVA